MLKAQFERSQANYINSPYPSLKTRRDNLQQLTLLIQDNAESLAKAISQDFGYRRMDETYLLECLPVLEAIRYAKANLKNWLKPQKPKQSRLLGLAKTKIIAQPLGVVGIVVPWNYPLNLSLCPLVNALAAGNVVILKLSERSTALATLLSRLLTQYQLPRVSVVSGDSSVARAFCQLPFAHLLFTGSSHVGKQVMAQASENLTPVTLELGGRSPVVISQSVKSHTLDRLWMGKFFNSGQTCVAPDHVYLPAEKQSLLIRSAKAAFRAHYPNNDLTAIISKEHFQRLTDLKADAISKGAVCVELSEQPFKADVFPPCLLFNVANNADILNEEIFGPIFPVIFYQDFAALVEQLKQDHKPLALYYFGQERCEKEQLMLTTLSGSLVINDTLLQAGIESLPFGGVGRSGMGQYHGLAGFNTFSNLKPVVLQHRWSSFSFLYPPFKHWQALIIQYVMGIKLTQKIKQFKDNDVKG